MKKEWRYCPGAFPKTTRIAFPKCFKNKQTTSKPVETTIVISLQKEQRQGASVLYWKAPCIKVITGRPIFENLPEQEGMFYGARQLCGPAEQNGNECCAMLLVQSQQQASVIK